jgi:hypothetical protein
MLGVLVPEVSDEGPYISYRNIVLQIGPKIDMIDQRIPVPIGMWKPFARGGVRVHPMLSGMAHVGTERAAVLICYEQLLAWPAAVSTLWNPTLALGVAKDASVRQTPIPALQHAYLRAWARLWGVPIVSAVAR